MPSLVPPVTTALALALFGAAGCNPDSSYEADLRELEGELSVLVEVLGTRNPATPRRLQIFLEPGPGATRSQDELCPVLRAHATLNGVAIPQLGDGLYTGAFCTSINYEHDLADAWPDEFNQPTTRIEISDITGTVLIEAPNIFDPPSASWLTPEDGELRVGSPAELRVTPGPEVLPHALAGSYVTLVAQQPRSFGLARLERTAAGVAIDLDPDTPSSQGKVIIEGLRGTIPNPFRGLVQRCDGAEVCSIERALCYDDECRFGMAYNVAFDQIELSASVL